jgi:hypothetical protein
MPTKILELANDFSTLYKKYNNEIVQHVLVENSVIDAGLIGNNHVSTASIQLDNTIIRIGTSRGLLDNDLLTYDALQYKFVNKSLAEFGFVGAADIANSITTDTLTANTISVTGDLVVAGNTITLDTQTLLVEDNIIVLGANNNTNLIDFGFAGQYSYDNGATTKYAGIFRDASIGKFYLFENYPLEPPTSTMTGFNPSSMSGTLILSNLEVLDDITLNTAVIAYNAANGTLDVNGNALSYDAGSTLASLSDVNTTANANQVLTADGVGNFNFNTVDYNNLINKPDAQLAALADDAFINSIIFG